MIKHNCDFLFQFLILNNIYEKGAGCTPFYAHETGSRLAKTERVVLCLINYRLGLLGFLHADGGVANAGLRDIIAALEFVQREIAAFGGNRDNVTVFGESAGAMLISALLVCPRAHGLYHRAILQSGGPINVLSAEQANALNAELADVFKLDGQRASVANLADKSTATLLAAQNYLLQKRYRRVGLMAFQVYVDGELVPEHPLDALQANSSVIAPVDVMIGFNRGSFTFIFHFILVSYILIFFDLFHSKIR